MKRMFMPAILASAIIFLSCSSNTADSVKNEETIAADSTGFTVKTIYSELSNPWGMVWLPDGRMLVTERAGEILVFKNDKFTGEKLKGVPAVFNKGQGGLMDIKLHPDYKKNGWIYITYAKPVEGGATTALARFKLNGNTITDLADIYTAKPYITADFHFGSRVVFDKDGYLYVSSGERGTQPKVQELDNDHGKIHRLFDDGRIPPDNPFVGQAGAHGSIWTLGHRNPQGMVYDAVNNRIWEVEHGPKGGDELNLIEKGKNYGWPKTSYGINYDGTVLTPNKELPGIENPKHYWVPSIATCGLSIVTGNKYPGWKGNLLVGALALMHINRVTLNGTEYKSEQRLLQNKGRFRYITESPDGYIYALSEGPGALIKLIPAK
ncbi:PQQ-dependent sugar dehydrogenase [Mucilaginibacter sp. UR6-1]|uniref:PQQ-dependent sugar dehydrogenase n=1 Tax=Mucilaginibacter sp. UR6-1 TaxID=1435643 RepID=UPI001E36D9D3|nr:PQQ-dependent sugar dehydrogenase [Mucilaginibacter sp. UR6-1]MCC8411109.1 PQQ-dependent sugar dehydrogenase [Mucilaginibacter sp. UR6-1]